MTAPARPARRPAHTATAPPPRLAPLAALLSIALAACASTPEDSSSPTAEATSERLQDAPPSAVEAEAGGEAEPSAEPDDEGGEGPEPRAEGEGEPEDDDESFFHRIFLSTAEAIGMPAPDAANPGAMFDTQPGVVEGEGEGEPEGDEDEDEDEGGFLAAPAPFHNPTIGYGLALGAAYLFKIDPKSPPSMIGGGGMYSENGSFGGAVAFKGYFKEDRYRLTAALLATRLNFDYTSGDDVIPLRESLIGGGLEFLVRSFERVYIGPQLIVGGIDTDIQREEDSGAIPDDQLQTTNIGLGVSAKRDTRDSVYYPRSGSVGGLQVRVFDPALGSPFAYQVVPVSYNHYLSLGERDVLAVRGSGRFAFGEVPFYGESYYGSNSDLRGYAVGTYHDDTLLAAQAEYRRELIWRMGVVGFAGLGTVAPDLTTLGQGELLPSVGFGLRFTLEEKNHVNFRIDFAWGRDQSAVYIGVGEAF